MAVGPIYGVELLDSLPLDGGMRQALPGADDLVRVRNVSERTVAGYEVLLEHYWRLQAIVKAQKEILDWYEVDHVRSGCDDSDVPADLRELELILEAAKAAGGK